MMRTVQRKPRIAVVSLFLDKRHGSERVMIEWLSHLPDLFEIHIYSQRVEDVDSKFIVHRIPKLWGPHLVNFLWWFCTSHLRLNWDCRFGHLQYDLIFSSGAEWPGADVSCVHIVFAEYIQRTKESMKLLRNRVSQWPLAIHRRLYYRLALLLERRAYQNPKASLVAHSRKTSDEITRVYGVKSDIAIIRPGIDHSIFNAERRVALRQSARASLGLSEQEFALILVGNDWRNKGVPVLIEALTLLADLPIRLMIVTREDAPACRELVREKGLDRKVSFLPPRSDIEFYYAAADAYAGPSLQDSYSMPPAEAMACGLPVIVSASAGVSEIVTHEVDGLILKNLADSTTLAAMIRRLYQDPEFGTRLGGRAAETARSYTWEQNGRELGVILQEILRRKAVFSAHTLTQES